MRRIVPLLIIGIMVLSSKTVQEFVLLGDPSLQIGGYP